jgi:hypothetical protein
VTRVNEQVAVRELVSIVVQLLDVGPEFLARCLIEPTEIGRLGYEFWRRSTAATVDMDIAPFYKWLVSNPESPWRKLAWDTPLEK